MKQLFDPQPVLELARLKLGDDGWRPDGTRDDASIVVGSPRLADICGVSQRTVHRWRAGGRMNHYTADRVAIRLGLHPCLIWDDWLDA